MLKIKEYLMKFDFKNVKISVWVRLAVWLISCLNIALAKAGHAPVPVAYEDVFMGVNLAIAFVAGLVNYWKNNSFTKAAQAADDQFHYNSASADGGLTETEAEELKKALAARKIVALPEDQETKNR